MLKQVVAVPLLVTALVGVVGWPAAQAEPRPPVIRVAIVADGPSERVDALRSVFLEELRAVNRGDFDIQAPAELQLEADRTLGGSRAVLERVLADRRWRRFRGRPMRSTWVRCRA